MYLCWLGTFPELMVQQQQQHGVSWGGVGGPKISLGVNSS
jgi:hypothetical protein